MNESVNGGRQNEDDESIETDTCCMCSGSMKMMCLKVLEQSRFTVHETDGCMKIV